MSEADAAAQPVLVHRSERVLELVLNRPQVRNALSFAMLRAIGDALSTARRDPEVAAVVISGAGGVFASGADVADMSRASLGDFVAGGVFDAWQEVAAFPKPIVAAVEGYALGGGLELVMSCDLVVAAEDARFGQPEVRLGLIPGAGGTQRLTRQLGPYLASEVILAGRMLSAAEMVRAGLVNRVVAPDRVLAEARSLAAAVAAQAPLAVIQAKAAIRAALETPLAAGLADERQRFYLLLATEDAAEGTRAFLEKRAPTWRGR